ncbi:glycosyltransferase WbuB [Comamonadaceae bacterium PP-2]
MKILIYGLNFSPELTGIGKYTGEMAAWLVSKGHQVKVICAPPYYPGWKIDGAYGSNCYKIEAIDGVTVYRAPLYVPKRPTGVKRILHLMSFACTSLPLLISQLRWKPDVVWVVEPPLLGAPAALLFSRFTGSKTWLHIQDFEIDAAFEMGILKSARLRGMIEKGERWLMSRFYKVSSISGRMIELAGNKGVDSSRLYLFRNWVNVEDIRPTNRIGFYRRELGIKDDVIVALYSGNMGGKQGLEVMARAARALQYNAGIKFVFCGNGAGRALLEKECESLNNVIFMDLQPIDRLNDLLGMADVHLLPQRADAADLVMPSKLTGMLASGRAVVVTSKVDTELGDVILNHAKCGLVVPPENYMAMAKALERLVENSSLREEFGRNGRIYAEKVLSGESILSEFEEELAS